MVHVAAGPRLLSWLAALLTAGGEASRRGHPLPGLAHQSLRDGPVVRRVLAAQVDRVWQTPASVEKTVVDGGHRHLRVGPEGVVGKGQGEGMNGADHRLCWQRAAELTGPEEDGGYGLSNRQTAEVLGVDEKTIRNTLRAENSAPHDEIPSTAAAVGFLLGRHGYPPLGFSNLKTPGCRA